MTYFLPMDFFVSPDVGRVFKVKGFVDFFVNSVLKYAIEVAREGVDMAEHRKRFEREGRYWPMMANVADWCILDFRTEEKGVRDLHDNVYHVLYSADFTVFTLSSPDGTREVIKPTGDAVRVAVAVVEGAVSLLVLCRCWCCVRLMPCAACAG